MFSGKRQKIKDWLAFEQLTLHKIFFKKDRRLDTKTIVHYKDRFSAHDF